MGFFKRISKCDAQYILTAFHRSEKSTYFYDNNLCSHSHEQDFFCRHYDFIRGHAGFLKPLPIRNFFEEIIAEYATDERFQESVMYKFLDITRNMSTHEWLLWCTSLLIDFHQKYECHEYVTLGLKMKLHAYWRSRYVDDEEPAMVMKTMTEFLDYISLYKSGTSHKLFINSFSVFSEICLFNFDDHLYPVFPKVFKAAQALHLNIFRYRRTGLLCRLPALDVVYYAQLAILYNIKIFLILIAYGYQDHAIPNPITLTEYKHEIEANDLSTFFGFRSVSLEEETPSHEQYRPFQVLLLYLYALCNRDREFYGTVLHILWESIPDPYLSHEQFMSSFKKANNFPEYLKVWNWYRDVVLEDAKYEKEPRSLKHLARCSVRRTLTDFGQLPSGIKVLDIPETLKDYLCISDYIQQLIR